MTRSDHFRFNLVLIKKTKLNFFLKKTKTGSNQPVSVRFGFFRTKPVQTDLAWFWLDYFGFGLVFPVWLGFFLVFFGLGSVRFFWFQAYKIKTKSN